MDQNIPIPNVKGADEENAEGASRIFRKMHTGSRRGPIMTTGIKHQPLGSRSHYSFIPMDDDKFYGYSPGLYFHMEGVETDSSTFIGSISEPRSASLRPSWTAVRERCG